MMLAAAGTTVCPYLEIIDYSYILTLKNKIKEI